MEAKKQNGGPGRGQGRKRKFDEPTKILYVRVPESKYDECKLAVEKLITTPLG